MNAMPPLPAAGRCRTITELLSTVVHGDGFACLMGDAGAGRTFVLDRVAVELANLRVRVLRLQCPSSGQLGLPELVAQVAGQFGPDASFEKSIELAFEALTEPGEDCGRIALLVDDAETLLPAAARYIEFAYRSCPRLRVVLAGPPGFCDGPDGAGFAGLRQRITCSFHLTAFLDQISARPDATSRASDPVASTGPEPHLALTDLAASGAASLSAELDGTNRTDLWSLAGVAVAALLLLATWTANWSEALLEVAAIATRDVRVAIFAPAEQIISAAPTASRQQKTDLPGL